MIDNTTLITLFMFLVAGISCFTHSKEIADHISGNYMTPLRWLLGEKPWIARQQEVIARRMRVMVKVAGLLCFGIITLVVVAIVSGGLGR